jgi:hypothetical protein
LKRGFRFPPELKEIESDVGLPLLFSRITASKGQLIHRELKLVLYG